MVSGEWNVSIISALAVSAIIVEQGDLGTNGASARSRASAKASALPTMLAAATNMSPDIFVALPTAVVGDLDATPLAWAAVPFAR